MIYVCDKMNKKKRMINRKCNMKLTSESGQGNGAACRQKYIIGSTLGWTGLMSVYFSMNIYVSQIEINEDYAQESNINHIN